MQLSDPTAPVEGIRIVFRRRTVSSMLEATAWLTGQQMDWLPIRTVQTGSDGRFTAALGPGLYRIEAVLSGFLQPEPANLSLAAGRHDGDVVLDLVPAAAVSGHVYDLTGEPLPSAIVRAVRPQYRDGRRIVAPCELGSPPGAFQMTGDRGDYRLIDLDAGEYYITATTAVAAAGAACFSSFWYYPGVTEPGDAIPVPVVRGGDIIGIDIHLTRTLLYQVSFEAVPPAGAWESFVPEAVQVSRRARDGTPVTVLVDGGVGRLLTRLGHGRYALPPLPPGSYDLFVRSGLARGIGRLSFDIVDRDVDVGTMMFPPLVPIQGRVRSAAGAFDTGNVRIALKPSGEVVPLSSLMAPYSRSMRPDGSGEFDTTDAMTGYPEGEYRVGVFGLPRDLYVASMRYGGLDVRDATLPLSSSMADHLLDIVIDGPGGVVSGRVTDVRGDSVGGSVVVLVPARARRQNPDAFRAVAADEHGWFTARGVPPGEYSLLAWRDIEEGTWLRTELLASFLERAHRLHVEKSSQHHVTVRVIEGGR